MLPFKTLNPILHSQLRLAIVSLLVSVESAEFTYIKDVTNATSGNVSVQLDKLNNAGYIKIVKSFRGKRPLTTCSITPNGKKAFVEYVNNLKDYISPSGK